MTLRQLRQMASDLGVTLYSRKSKEDLVSAIAERQERRGGDLKAIEAGGHGLALLASNVLYERSLVAGVTAELFSDSAQLRRHLQTWRRQPDLARQLGKRARQWVASECLASHQVARRDAWYRDLVSRRDQLNKTLIERVPELAAKAAD